MGIKCNKQWFSILSTVLEHSRIVSWTQKNVRALDCISCSKLFLHAGNSCVLLLNSTEHAEPLFIALTHSVRDAHFRACCPPSADNEIKVHANWNLHCRIPRGAFACILLLLNLMGKIL